MSIDFPVSRILALVVGCIMAYRGDYQNATGALITCVFLTAFDQLWLEAVRKTQVKEHKEFMHRAEAINIAAGRSNKR